jgi:hypothetical protein
MAADVAAWAATAADAVVWSAMAADAAWAATAVKHRLPLVSCLN